MVGKVNPIGSGDEYGLLEKMSRPVLCLDMTPETPEV